MAKGRKKRSTPPLSPEVVRALFPFSSPEFAPALAALSDQFKATDLAALSDQFKATEDFAKRIEGAAKSLGRPRPVVIVQSSSNQSLPERAQPSSEQNAALRNSKSRKASQQDRVRRVLPKIFPPDGAVPDHVSTKEVWGKVAAELASENKQKGLAEPSWESVARAIGRL